MVAMRVPNGSRGSTSVRAAVNETINDDNDTDNDSLAAGSMHARICRNLADAMTPQPIPSGTLPRPRR